jgi:hypothetical protein
VKAAEKYAEDEIKERERQQRQTINDTGKVTQRAT